MIQDVLSNLSRYQSSLKWLDQVDLFIKSLQLKSLPLGKTVIQGDDLYVNTIEYQTTPMVQPVKMECHQNYIDLHLLLQGEEQLVWSNIKLQALEAYNPQSDTSFFSSNSYNTLNLNPDHFALFLPGEAHLPLLAVTTPMDIRKLVFKIKL